ncbi:uncharacterized skeletal organic matrix protein 5-like [Dendronephthya gigantea]|uniref:uncharacterized skeletal organic matrix protein 5-like n=1 Tax=Dendronephthya gigantea TaxID=151771 RepID=UPI00106B037C|nr:uncharacterized skeletal organic matrix protein 5-like [Dendronephthya gigantea]
MHYNSCVFQVHNFSCLPKIYASCKEVFEKNSSAPSGAYHLQLNKKSEVYQAYCYNPNQTSVCGGGAWTLVMILNGAKPTFRYHSPLWTNKETFNAEAALNDRGFEAKLASYHNTPFTKICLIMRANNKNAKSIVLNYTASSLYSVIAGQTNHVKTNTSSAKWMSLIDSPTMQQNCNMEGFNMKFLSSELFLRIGLVGSHDKNCSHPETWLGYGLGGKYKYSSGNGNGMSGLIVQTFGYISVQ